MKRKKVLPILGIDLGGTNTKLGLVNAKGKLLVTGSVPTLVSQGPLEWAHRIKEMIDGWGEKFSAIGVASPGPLQTKTGTILQTPNLREFEGFSMAKVFKKLFRVPVFFENDANCAALAEFYFGPYKGQKHIVVLTLGTGVGSGVISEGKLIRGVSGYATELGHMIIDRRGPKCFCGKMGCFEAMVGARGTTKRYKDLTGQELSLAELFEEKLLKSSPQARKIFDDWVESLSIGLANTANIFDPQTIILSGGVVEAWDKVRAPVHQLLSTMIPQPVLESLVIEASQLGKYFGVLGASALVLHPTSLGS